MSEVFSLSASEMASAIRKRALSALEVTQAALARIRSLDKGLRAFLLVDEEGALAQARSLDQLSDADRNHLPLLGVPLGVKDILCVAGQKTTCGSKILQDFVSPYDATVVHRLRRAGAVLLGKLNMDEFAMGSSGEHSAYGCTKNPWDQARVPGGSSSGSAAAVAASFCPLALGSDTGGSVRQPAALCGVSGMKPTYGLVSRYGLVAYASSLDQVGVLGNSAGDLALCLDAIAGPDPLDATCRREAAPPLRPFCDRRVDGLRIGVPREYFERSEGLDPDVYARCQEALLLLQEQGARLVEVSLPLSRYAVAAYYVIATAEASSNLARYDGVRYGARKASKSLAEMYSATRGTYFGQEVKRRLLLGTYVLRSGYYDAYYLRASKVRTLLCKELQEAFRRCDVLATPTSPVTAFPFGTRSEPLSMYLADIYTVTANLAGLPGISVPCGFARDGLPVGLQFLGPPLADGTVLQVAASYQRETSFHRMRPSLKSSENQPPRSLP